MCFIKSVGNWLADDKEILVINEESSGERKKKEEVFLYTFW